MAPGTKHKVQGLANGDATSLPHVCLSSSALFTPPNSNVRYREAKRCPSLPYRWQDSLAVSAIGTFSLERYRPSTQRCQDDDRNLPGRFAPRHTDSDLRPALPLRQFQAEIRLSAVGSGCDKRGSLSDRGQNSLDLDRCLRHLRLRSRVCQPGCCPWIRSAIPADPLGMQGCGRRLPQVRHRSPASLLKLLHQHWGIAAVRTGGELCPLWPAWMASPVPAVRAPNAYPVP